MFFWKYCSSVKPLTVSTNRPLQSALVPYCQREPGSNISGVSGATVPSGRLVPVCFLPAQHVREPGVVGEAGSMRQQRPQRDWFGGWLQDRLAGLGSKPCSTCSPPSSLM